MKATYAILVDEPESNGIYEQIAFLVDETHGKIIAVDKNDNSESFTEVIAEWPQSYVIDADLQYGFVHPMHLVEKIQGVLGWKSVTTS